MKRVRRAAADAQALPDGSPAAPVAAGTGIARDFADPYLECLSLLQTATEIEHALMLQYLYAAFSVKDQYPTVRGERFDGPTSLVGLAVEEMHHLHTVNQLLVALGGAPNLLARSFPFSPDIYPFTFHLERLSRASLATYVYAEAPARALDRDDPANASEQDFLDLLFASLGDVRPNNVGSLYASLIVLLPELADRPELAGLDVPAWVARLEEVKANGEQTHFLFFKDLFLGRHPGFGGRAVWDADPAGPDYPSNPVPSDPSAYVGHARQIADEGARRLAWLADLQYWIVLVLLQLAYRHGDEPAYLAAAKAHMVGPLWHLGLRLGALGTGVPFDALGMQHWPGLDRAGSVAVLARLVDEAKAVAAALGDAVPADYPAGTDDDTLAMLRGAPPVGRVSPRNRTAQLAYRARGNPPGTLIASSVGNYYPGLEIDLRNVWRRMFVGIQLHEAVAVVTAVEDDAPDAVRALLGEILVSVDGHPVWVEVTGPKSVGGPSEVLRSWSLEWSNALADVVPKAGTTVPCVFTRGDGATQEVSLQVRAVFDAASVAASATGVLSTVLARPGELTESLCSPWQNDFVGCGCYYWAASRPDYVNVERDEAAGSRGHNWLQKGRTAATPKVYTMRRSEVLAHEDLIAGWEDKLTFVLGGRDEPAGA